MTDRTQSRPTPESATTPFAEHDFDVLITAVRRFDRGMVTGVVDTAKHLATHVMPVDDGPHGYDPFKNTKDGNLRSVFVLAG
jgi:hypothetical protein